MENQSKVAKFVAERLQMTRKPQYVIAREAGFEKPQIISMIKQGKTRLPLERIGMMAKALETCPLELLRVCLDEYSPGIWNTIEPYLECGLTEDEARLIRSLRHAVGGPYLLAMGSESRKHFNNLLQSLREPTSIH